MNMCPTHVLTPPCACAPHPLRARRHVAIYIAVSKRLAFLREKKRGRSGGGDDGGGLHSRRKAAGVLRCSTPWHDGFTEPLNPRLCTCLGFDRDGDGHGSTFSRNQGRWIASEAYRAHLTNVVYHAGRRRQCNDMRVRVRSLE